MVFGSFETSSRDWLDKNRSGSYRSAIPLKRFGRPDEAAQLALSLASDETKFITGQDVAIDRGEVMR
jgi:3-oxoacyl-[acyl-carrier protein] reductase